MRVGFVLSVEGWKTKRLRSPEEEGSLPPDVLQTQGCSISPSRSLQSALRISDLPTIMPPSLSPTPLLCMLMQEPTPPLLGLFPWRALTNTWLWGHILLFLPAATQLSPVASSLEPELEGAGLLSQPTESLLLEQKTGCAVILEGVPVIENHP